ncbi:MAG TPA: hypothetical protein VJ869_13505 [Sphaerochaeta sp.]|nr:hypothetical protein [Sphaerochaeta sp.]
MKQSIAILLVLALVSAGLFSAPVNHDKNDATINISTDVNAFSAFGVSNLAVADDGFKSIAKFQGSVASSISTEVDMLNLHSFVDVGFLSGINNASGDVKLFITIKDLISGDNAVSMEVSPKSATINASKDSAFGTLKNTVIQVKESTVGAAALAPAGKYNTTVTISLVTVS